MKTTVLLLLMVFSLSSIGQVETDSDDSLKQYYGDIVPVYTKDYLNTYNRLKRIIVKVYPYALYAADVIDEIDENAENIRRRRKKNSFYKDEYKLLKDKFKYFLLDLYTTEGEMLMKLIYRETGMTVFEISSKYQSKQKAEVFNLMAKLWDQDLNVKFDPKEGNDKIAEQVIMDIQSGIIPFDDEIVTIDKLEYRDKQHALKEKKKEREKKNKAYEKERKKREKERERVQRKKDKYNKS